jgi:hypothetical protein
MFDEVPEFTVVEDAAWVRGVVDPVLADRGPYELKRRHRRLDEHHRNLAWRRCGPSSGHEGNVVVEPPPEGREEDEDAPEREDFEEAEDEPTPGDGGSPSETDFFAFCLYRRPRVVAATPSLGPSQVARRLAAEWLRLSAADREAWRAPAPPRRPRGETARRGCNVDGSDPHSAVFARPEFPL